MFRKLREQWEEEFDMALCVPYYVDSQGIRIDMPPDVFRTKKARLEELERRVNLAKKKRKRMEEQVSPSNT